MTHEQPNEDVPESGDKGKTYLKIHLDDSIKHGLKKYIEQRFKQLYGDYKTLMFPCDDPEAKAIAEATIAKAEKCLAVEDIYNMEKALLKLWPVDRLRREAWELRAQYRDLAGSGQYDLYQKSNPPNPETADETALRSDLMQIQDQIHHLMILLPARAKAGNFIANRTVQLLLGTAIVYMLAVAWLFFVDAKSNKLHMGATSLMDYLQLALTGTLMLMIVAFFGILGGTMSTLRRLQTAPEGNPMVQLYGLVYGGTSIIVAPVSGAIFAVILYMIFAAKIITGPVFPECDAFDQQGRRLSQITAETKEPTPPGATASPSSAGPATTKAKNAPPPNAAGQDNPGDFRPIEFFFNTHPVALKDYAAVVLWSFLAGFAEQLVPDALDRLKSRTVASEDTKSVNSQKP